MSQEETPSGVRAKPITRGWASDIMGSPVDRIVALVSSAFGVEPVSLFEETRDCRDVVLARQVCHFIARHKCNMSYPELGRYLSRDHTTILSNVRKVQRMVERDSRVATIVARIVSELNDSEERAA
jgi:chromosomal replication initiation ATPase DnaA